MSRMVEQQNTSSSTNTNTNQNANTTTSGPSSAGSTFNFGGSTSTNRNDPFGNIIGNLLSNPNSMNQMMMNVHLKISRILCLKF
jgi:hypothetical protein